MLFTGKPSARLRTALLAMTMLAPLAPLGAFAVEHGETVLWVDGLTTETEGSGTVDRPFRTIAAAVTALPVGGGTINVLPAVYDESVTLSNGFTLQGAPATDDRPAAGPLPQDLEGCVSWSGLIRGVISVVGDDVAVRGLTLMPPTPSSSVISVAATPDSVDRLSIECNLFDAENTGSATWGVETVSSAESVATDLRILRNTFRNIYGGVYLNAGAVSTTIDGNVFDRMILGGVSSDSAGSVIITNNVFTGGKDGVWIGHHNADTVVRGNSFSGHRDEALDYDPVEPALDARQNWWGSPSGPRSTALAPGDIQPSPDPEQEPGTEPVDDAQDEAARQVIDGNIDVDPWCRAEGCSEAPILIKGVVSDGSGPVEGAVVRADWGDGQAVTSQPTDGTGAYRIDFTLPWDEVEGTELTLTATRNDWSAQESVTLGAEPQVDRNMGLQQGTEQGSATQSGLSAKPMIVPADGTTAATVSVTVRTADGQLRTSPDGDAVEVATTFGELDEPQWVGDGVWQAHLTSTQPGDAEVFAFVNGQPVNTSVEIEFVVGPPSPEHSTITSSKALLTADGTSESTITVTVRDGGGNLREAGDDFVRLSLSTKADGTPNGTLGPLKDNGNGTYTAEYRSSTTTGTAVISAHVRESMVHEEVTLEETASIALTPGPASGARSTMRSDDTELPADGTTPLIVTVQVKDAHGNNRTRAENAPADTVTFTSDFVATEEEPPVHRPMPHPAVSTDENGVATIQIPSAEKGRMTVTAKVGDQPVTGSVVATFGDVPPAPDPSKSTIGSNATTRAANGTHAATITLQVKGTDGANYAGSVQVSLSATGGGKLSSSATTPGTQNTISGSTSSSGKFEAYLTSAAVGQVSVTGAIGSTTITDASGQPVAATVTFTAVSSPAHSTLSDSKSDADANGSDSVTITFQARDANGQEHNVAGQRVVLSTSLGTLATASGTTNSSGVYTATLTSSTAGTAVVSATLNGDPVSSSAQVKFHAPADATKTDIVSNRQVVGADGVRTATITLQLKDASGAHRARQGQDTVQAVVQDGVVASTPVYVEDGKWQFDVSSRIVREDSPVSAKVRTSPIGTNVLIDFEPPTVAAQSRLTRSHASEHRRADGTEFVTIEVQANNLAGTARRGDGDEVRVTVDGLGAQRLLTPVHVGGGKYSLNLTSIVAGTAIVKATINGENVQNGGSAAASVSVTFIAVASPAHSTVALTSGHDQRIAGVTGLNAATVNVQAKYWNGSSAANMTTPGDTVTLATTHGSFHPSNAVASVTLTTNSSGVATATLYGASVGPAVLSAELNGATVSTPMPTVTYHPAAHGPNSRLTAAATQVLGNDSATVSITLHAIDAAGNPRSTGGESSGVVLTASNGGAFVSTLTDNNNGTYSRTVKRNGAGSVTVSGTIHGQAIGTSVTVEFVGKGAAANSTATLVNNFVAANNSNVANVIVQVRRADTSMQTVPGDTIALTTAPGVTASTPVYQGGGAYAFTVKSSVPAQTVVGIKVNGEDMPADKWPSITFEPVTAPDKTTITALTSPILGNGLESSVIEVQTKNAAGSDRRGVDDTVVLSVGAGHAFSNGQQTVTATPADTGKYTATLTSTTPGTATVTGTVNGVAITGGNATVTVHGPTSAAHSVLSPEDEEVVADGVSEVVIELMPMTAASQPRETSGDTVVLTTDRGSFKGAPAATPQQIPAVWNATSKTYQAKLVTGTVAGLARITGTVNGAPIGDPPGGLVVQFVPGAASKVTSLVEADPEKITADGSSLSTITVTLKDANDNALTQSHTQPVTVSSTRGSVISVTNNNDGTYTALLRAASAAAVATVWAKIGPNSTDFVTDTATVTMEAKTVASASQITANPTSAPADGQSTVELTVQARSSASAPRTIGGDTVELTASRGTLSAVTDNQDGTYSVMLTAPVQSGAVTIGGEINDAALPTTTVNFFAVTKAAGSDISASPTLISANGTSTSTITLTAKDHAGVARTTGGEAVVLSTDDGTLSSVTDNSNGTYTATLTAPTSAGSATISGTIGGAAVTDTATVTFVAVTSPANSTITASPTSLYADGASTATITVAAKDYAGSARTVGGDTVVLSTTLGSVGTVTDNSNGTYTATFTAGTQSGTAEITGTIGGVAITDDAEIVLNEVTAPSAPASASGEDGDGEATISWTEPSDDGGSPITGYRISAEPAADVTGNATRTVGAEDRSLVFTGLTNGVTYTFTVVAVNARDLASEAAPVQNVRPWGAPGAPTDVEAQRGDREATVTWTPGSDGGRSITHYVITATNLATNFVHTAKIDAPATSGTVTGLVNGGTYDVHVQAVSEVNEEDKKASLASDIARVVPAAVPDEPTGLTAVAGNTKVALSWTAPAEDGGESVDSYIVTVTPAGGAATHETATTTLDVTGLVNGTAYTFTVAAKNGVGAGPDSESVIATPTAPPAGGGGGGGGGGVPAPSPTATAGPTPGPTPSPTSAPGPLPGPGPVRINGEDRASTAAAVSASHFDPGVAVVYVATAANFADALAGGPAAAHGGGPVLLVERDRVPESTSFELQRLEPDRVVVLGGTGAVSDLVAEQLDETAPVERVSGTDRFATAAAVSAATFPEHTPVVYIATGSGFADALSGGAAAARDRGPVLLAGDGELPEATAAELRRLAPRQIVVLGGSGAVSPEVAAALEEYTDGAVERLSGPDRYATSAAIAARMFPVAVDTVFIATGENFPDALAGVPAAAREKAPLLLVRHDAVPETVAAQLERLRPRRIVILGGSGAVSAETEDALSDYTVD